MTRQWFRIEAKAEPDVVDLYIFDEIGKTFWNDTAVYAARNRPGRIESARERFDATTDGGAR